MDDTHVAMIGAAVAEAATGLAATTITELNLAAWQNIVPFRDGWGIPTTNLIRAYVRWHRSVPPATAISANVGTFAVLERVIEDTDHRAPISHDSYECYKEWLLTVHRTATSNGALVRIPALATWASIVQSEFPLDQSIAEADTMLTHPSELCLDASKVYARALTLLLMKVEPETVLDVVTDFVAETIQSEEVRRWFLEDSARAPEDIHCTEDPGHVRHAFVLAMYFLRNTDISYEEAISYTLQKGGDVAANAAVVGALVACYQPVPAFAVAELATVGAAASTRPKEYLAAALIDKSIYKFIANEYRW